MELLMDDEIGYDFEKLLMMVILKSHRIFK
jgi:hypothetical protein